MSELLNDGWVRVFVLFALVDLIYLRSGRVERGWSEGERAGPILDGAICAYYLALMLYVMYLIVRGWFS